jgi:hypothetical protein
LWRDRARCRIPRNGACSPRATTRPGDGQRDGLAAAILAIGPATGPGTTALATEQFGLGPGLGIAPEGAPPATGRLLTTEAATLHPDAHHPSAPVGAP